MKITPLFKKALWVTLGTIGLLVIVLVVHIAMVTSKKPDNATLQVSRIDFAQPMSPELVAEVHRNLKSIPGVKSDHFVPERGVVVFFHDNRISDSEKIYDRLMELGPYDAKRFTVPKELASKGVCPAMSGSFTQKLTFGVQRLFN